MEVYLTAGIILALISGYIAKSILKMQQKWTDTFSFLGVAIVLGIILVLIRDGLGLWYTETWMNVCIGVVAYLFTYYLFYREYKGKYPKTKIGFLKFVDFNASHGKTSFQEVSIEDTLADAFRSERVRNALDNSQESSFFGWFAMLINGFLFTIIVVGIAGQNSLNSFFSTWVGAILTSSDMKLIFGVLVILVVIVVIGKITGLDK